MTAFVPARNNLQKDEKLEVTGEGVDSTNIPIMEVGIQDG